MPANYILGKDGKFYIHTTLLFSAVGDTPDYSTPTLLNGGAALTEFTNVRSVSISTDTEEVDITSRATSGFKATVATLKDSTLEFELVWIPSDTNFQEIRDAWLNSTEIAVLAMDGAWNTSGNSGLIGNFTVPGFSREEDIGDVMRTSVTMKGSSFVTWYEHA